LSEQKRYIAETVPGFTGFLQNDLKQLLRPVPIIRTVTDDEIEFTTHQSIENIHIPTAQALYVVEDYDIPRPKAFLGNAHLFRLLDQIQFVLRQKHNRYGSLHLAAAGSDSSVMVRLKEELAKRLSLPVNDDAGDLLIRIRKNKITDQWQVLVRLSPRPLATRPWRICDMPGALNAVVAHTIGQLAIDKEGESLLCNLASGSGSILIEHLLRAKNHNAVGVELDADVMRCAQQNIEAAGIEQRAHLICGDMTRLPFENGSLRNLCADLPFGQRVGSHQINTEVYPLLWAEAGRVAQSGATFVILTHEIRLLSDLLYKTNTWSLKREIKITLRGLHPRIYVLQRS